MRRDLCSRTKHANRVVVKQCGSAAGAGYAKAERDLTDEFVKLQVCVRAFRSSTPNAPNSETPSANPGSRKNGVQKRPNELRFFSGLFLSLKFKRGVLL